MLNLKKKMFLKTFFNKMLQHLGKKKRDLKVFKGYDLLFFKK